MLSKSCPRNHENVVRNARGDCLQCRSQRISEWQRAHPEKCAAYARKSRMKHRPSCKQCGADLPYPAQGRRLCSASCREAARRAAAVNRHQAQRERVSAHKESIGCCRCGYNEHGAALDWHHTDPATKHSRISVNSYFTPMGRAEREKCILLCAICHRLEHHVEQRQLELTGDVL